MNSHQEFQLKKRGGAIKKTLSERIMSHADISMGEEFGQMGQPPKLGTIF